MPETRAGDANVGGMFVYISIEVKIVLPIGSLILRGLGGSFVKIQSGGGGQNGTRSTEMPMKCGFLPWLALDNRPCFRKDRHMAETDFDVMQLAKFLQLSPQRVEKLAERDKLPGRKIGGAWRFSRAEIHHWMEERMGSLSESELVEMEGTLDREASIPDMPQSVTELLSIDAMAVPLAAKTKDRAITAMVDLAAGTGQLWDPAKMIDAVRSREQMHPTAMPGGVALLHPRRPLGGILGEPLLAYGRTVQGIPFGGGRNSLTDIFFLICSVDDTQHLRTLARLSRLIGDGEFLSVLREAPDAVATHQLIAEREASLEE